MIVGFNRITSFFLIALLTLDGAHAQQAAGLSKNDLLVRQQRFRIDLDSYTASLRSLDAELHKKKMAPRRTEWVTSPLLSGRSAA